MKRMALVATLVGSALCACNPAPPPNRHPVVRVTPRATPTLPPLRITGHGTKHEPVRITQSEGGRIVYRVTADAYEGTSTLAIARLRNANITFIDRSGATLHARAPQTLIDDRHARVTMDGGVHAQGQDGRTLDCDELLYDRTRGMLHATGNVVIAQNGGRGQAVARGNDLLTDITLTRTVMR